MSVRRILWLVSYVARYPSADTLFSLPTIRRVADAAGEEDVLVGIGQQSERVPGRSL